MKQLRDKFTFALHMPGTMQIHKFRDCLAQIQLIVTASSVSCCLSPDTNPLTYFLSYPAVPSTLVLDRVLEL